jgi:TRAP-type mannitol/chloroaromatic compound transport system substrate-binding protein
LRGRSIIQEGEVNDMISGSRILSAIACLAAVALVPAPASAQDKKIRMQVAGAYPSSLTLLGPAQQYTVDKLRKLSAGSIDAKFFEPGALVPANQYFDAVANGALDSAWTASGFFSGKEIALALYSTVPFGPEISEFLGWFRYGGGQQLFDELGERFKLKFINCGIVPPEASGWFRKEINSLEDLKGLKMRFFGLGANVMQKLGVATQLLQAGEIFQALQLGTIDATEFSAPALDISMGLHQVAKHYYFPGWHQMASLTHLIIGQAKWAEMSDTQKEVVHAACEMTMLQTLAEGESKQVPAINDIRSKGVTTHSWSPAIMAAYRKAWAEVVEEQKAKSPAFKKGWDSLAAYREQYKIWKDLAYIKD